MGNLEDIFRTLGGFLLIMGIILCLVVCLYKYAICQKNKENNSTINVIPRQYTELESKHNSGIGIVVSSV